MDFYVSAIKYMMTWRRPSVLFCVDFACVRISIFDNPFIPTVDHPDALELSVHAPYLEVEKLPYPSLISPAHTLPLQVLLPLPVVVDLLGGPLAAQANR